jgi:two-component system, LuxR family, sensor kinase FixL
VDDYTGDRGHLLRHESLRKSGLQALGDIPWGAHFCVLYSSPEELLDVLVPYFAAGLAENEFCMWVTSDLVDVRQARASLRELVPEVDSFVASGQLEILSHTDWYLRDGRFDGERVMRAWADKLAAAERLGFSGLRLSGDTFWLEKADWRGFMRYEEMVERVISSDAILALCAYPLLSCNPRETFDVIANHDFAMIKEDGRWLSFKSVNRRRLGQALRESEGRQHAILEAVQDAIVAFDNGGSIVSINAAGARMFGYEIEELVGAEIGSILPDLGSKLAALHPYMKNRIHSCKETTGRRSNGEDFPVELNLAQTAHQGSPIIVGSARDLSEKYRAEARLKRLQVDRLAAMGGIAAGLAHELNQPLSATKTYLKVIERLVEHPHEDHPVRIEDALARAAEQVERAGRIISSLRGLAAQGEPNMLIQSLHRLIEQICECFAGTFADLRIAVTLELGAANDTVLVDGVQIQQVLSNLMKNAVEAMTKTQCRGLTISTSIQDGDILVEVADSGTGIPENIKGQLFEPLPSTKDGGMGVGLPMSRVIVEAHEGQIWARDNIGRGAVLSFTLPLMEGIYGLMETQSDLAQGS